MPAPLRVGALRRSGGRVAARWPGVSAGAGLGGGRVAMEGAGVGPRPGRTLSRALRRTGGTAAMPVCPRGAARVLGTECPCPGGGWRPERARGLAGPGLAGRVARGRGKKPPPGGEG